MMTSPLASIVLRVICAGGISWASGSLQAQAETSASSNTPVLPLPESKEGQEMLNPLLTIPPEGLGPLPADFKIEEIPANHLAHWSIARFPSRENRDATAAFWSRVGRSKTRWQVWLDPKTGEPVADEQVRTSQLPKFDWHVETAEKQVLAFEPKHVWACQQGWLIQGTDENGDSVLAWFSKDGTRRHWLGAWAEVQHVKIRDRDFLWRRRSQLIQELKITSTGSQLTPFYELGKGQQICAITELPEQRLGMVTSQRLLALSLDLKVETLLAHPGWAAFQPTSAIYDPKSQRVYVGMRHFVARCAIEPGKRASVLLRPSGS